MSVAIVEVQTPGGAWAKVGECSSAPETIKNFVESNHKSNPKWKRFRVLDSKTKQMIDFYTF